jgi:hypothetical protein
MLNVANEVSKSGKLGKLQRHREGRMPDQCHVFCVNEDEPGLKTLHPMAGRIKAPIRHGQVAHTIPLNPG